MNRYVTYMNCAVDLNEFINDIEQEDKFARKIHYSYELSNSEFKPNRTATGIGSFGAAIW